MSVNAQRFPASPGDTTDLITVIEQSLSRRDLAAASTALTSVSTRQVVQVLDRLSPRQRAVAYRLLAKQQALEVFESLSPGLQGELLRGLQDAEVAAHFAGLDPDDRVWLLDELPASIAPRLLRGLPERERELTAAVLGYPHDYIGRRMSPEYVTT